MLDEARREGKGRLQRREGDERWGDVPSVKRLGPYLKLRDSKVQVRHFGHRTRPEFGI